jgi:hypothetical protein
MKMPGGVEIQLHHTLALDGGEWLASRLGHFTPKERVPGNLYRRLVRCPSSSGHCGENEHLLLLLREPLLSRG